MVKVPSLFTWDSAASAVAASFADMETGREVEETVHFRSTDSTRLQESSTAHLRWCPVGVLTATFGLEASPQPPSSPDPQHHPISSPALLEATSLMSCHIETLFSMGSLGV